MNGERAEQAIADAVREVFDGHCGTGARVDPEPPSWEQVGREVVAGLAAQGGVVVWLGDEATVDAVAMRLCALENGTTGMVALRHNRSFVGIELNPTYAALARHRIVDDAPLLNQPAEAA